MDENTERRFSAIEREQHSMRTEQATIKTQNAVSIVQTENTNKRLGEIEDTLKWLVRLIIGGILLAALTFVVQGGLNVS